MKGGFVRGGFVRGGFVRGGFVRGGFVQRGFVRAPSAIQACGIIVWIYLGAVLSHLPTRNI